ncbi:NAD(P)-binding protein [Meredithblackwellia eburnea MCA 4105]
MSTIYLISGANRGLGFGLTKALSEQAENIVYAGTRQPAKSKELLELAAARPNVHPIELSSANVEDNKAAAKKIEQEVGKLDVVIANAGVSHSFAPALEVSIDAVRDHFEVNTLGPLILFQAVGHLLLKGTNPKWILMSTGAASMGKPFPIENTAYGTSKAAANFIITRIHREYPSVTTIAINPGWVQTDLGNHAATSTGRDKADLTVEESVAGVLGVVAKAQRKEAAQYVDYKGNTIPW